MSSHADSHRVYLPAHVPSYLAQAYCSSALDRTYKGGVVSVLLGVSSHHRALPFLPFPLPSWVLDLHCLFLSAGVFFVASAFRPVWPGRCSSFLLEV